VDDYVCRSLWGTASVSYSYQPSIGASGGILTLWDVTEVEVLVTKSVENVLIIQGWFINSNNEFSIANVYASLIVEVDKCCGLGWAS